ncbi:MAG TPA: polyprenyl synthetase family protein [Acidimicrobiales bacterium]|nr:polyprenyl synthetase family protein [Acidimicrobiales bacterium]
MSPIAALVESRVRSVLAAQRTAWAAEQPSLAEMFGALDAFVAAGGKRLRPAFCYWGAVGAGASGDEPELLDTCAALELLHAFALIHDDVMDGSATRRGAPAVHMRFAREHAASGWAGESRRHGEGLAILTGDLAFVLADALLDGAPAGVRRLWHEMRLELVAGQWVDVVAARGGERSPALARWVARYKSGRYTVERPLQLGAALAGDDLLMAGYTAFGEPLGQAFQLRDDILGVFGDPSETGKPSGDDLREGKPTLLLALATEYAAAGDRHLIDRVGSPDLSDDEVADLRSLFEQSGARAMVEQEIAWLVERSERALALWAVEPDVRDRLRALAERAVVRDR